MERKKIVLFSISKETLSGGQNMIFNILKSIDRQLFDIELIVQFECPLSIKARNEGIIVHVLPIKDWKFQSSYNLFLKKFTRTLNFLLNSFKIAKFIKNNKYDLVWCENLSALLLCMLLKFNKTKLVYNMWSCVNSYIGQKIIICFANHIIVEANFQKEFFNKFKNKPNITRIYTQIDEHIFKIPRLNSFEARKKMNLVTQKKVIGFLGGGRYSKGFDLFIEAAYKMVKEDGFNECLFVVGGMDKNDDMLKNSNIMEKVKSLESNLVLIDWIEEKEVFYQAINIFVSLSRSEGLPGAVREAMGFELPVIATDVGGTSEVIGEAGYLVEGVEDNDKIIGCISYIKDILSKESEALSIAKKAKTRVFQNFIGNSWVSELDTVFVNILEQREDKY
jgi:glycosyltransferase involved in cell wall biosynthesis